MEVHASENNQAEGNGDYSEHDGLSTRVEWTGQGSIDTVLTQHYSGMIFHVLDLPATLITFAEDPRSGPLSYITLPLHW